MKKNELVTAVRDIIDNASNQIEAAWLKPDLDVILTSRDLQLHLYVLDKIVGYTIHDINFPRYEFLSDTDLYDLTENPDLQDSMFREILYILKEYCNDDITITETKYRSWLGFMRRKHSLSVNLPTGKRESYRLPAINSVDFEL